MSFEKSHIRAAMAHEIGSQADDMLENAKNEMYRVQGMNVGLLKGQESLENLLKTVDLDVSEGKLDLEQSKLVKLWVQRSYNVIMQLAAQAADQVLVYQGRIQAAETFVKVVKQLYDREQAQAERHAAMDADTAPPSGSRMSLKEQRLLEEAEESQSAATSSDTAAEDVDTNAAEVLTSEDKPKRKRQRKAE